MAAPSGTKWGSVAGGYGRIGLYITTSNTQTQTTANIEIWFWSKYSVSDSSNTLYWDDQQANPSTSRGSVNISTSNDSGSGWNTANQVRIATTSVTHSRGHNDVEWVFGAKLTGVEAVGGTMTVNTTWHCPGKVRYPIRYSANGGSGAPSNQIKYYGESITLSSTRPTRTGYTFEGWGTSESDTTPNYQPGATYTANAELRLWAVWERNSYTVTFNANGGSVSPTSRSVLYGNTVGTLPTPTRANYTFLGWYTSASGGTQITSSQKVTGNVTYYAHWRLNSYVVTFNANGGTVSPTSRTVNYGSQIGTLPTPTRQYHTFLGWYTSATGGSQVYSNTTVRSAMTIYAHWRRDAVAYVKNGSSWKRGSVYMKSGGSWKRGTAYVKNGGSWKRGVGG